MLRTHWISGLCVSATVLIGNSVFATVQPTYTYQDKIAKEILSCSTPNKGRPPTTATYAFCQQLNTASNSGTGTIGWYLSNATNSNLDVENHLVDSGQMSAENILYLCPQLTFPVTYQSSNNTFFTKDTSATAEWTTQAAPTACANQTPTTQTAPSKATPRSAYNDSNTIGYTRTCSSNGSTITYAWCMQPPKSYPAPIGFNPQRGWYPAALNLHGNNVYTCPTDNHQDVAPAKWNNNQSSQSEAQYYVNVNTQDYPPNWTVDSTQHDSNCGSIQHETIAAVPQQVTG